MMDKLAALERRMEAFEERLRRAEERATAGGSSPAVPAETTEREPPPDAAVSAAPALLSAAGRTCVILGGAFLIRALTVSGALSPRAGVAAAFLYGIVWLAVALVARRGGAGSTFAGITGIVIAFPVVWEAYTRWHVATPAAALAGAALACTLATAAAWRQDTSWLAWASAIGSSVLFAALASATGRLDAVAALAIGLAIGLAGLAYARRWPGPRWLAAAAADAFVGAAAAVVARDGGPPIRYRAVTAASALALAAALPLASLALFGLRALWRKRSLLVFEVVQSVAALVVGFGCATAVARRSGLPAAAVGLPALATAVALYAIAFGFVGRDAASRGNFHFFASLGLLTALLGGVLWLSAPVLSGTWGLFALACAASGARFGRNTLRVHATVYLLSAFLVSGLGGGLFDAFVAAAGRPWRPYGASDAAVSIVAAIGAAGALRKREPSSGIPARISALAFTVVAAAGCGAAVLQWVAGNGAGTHARPAAVAALRTATLAGSAILLAFGARRRPDFSWIVYAVLVAGAIKILAEDLPRGTPVSLGAGFALYGAALTLCPRILRPRSARDGPPPRRK